MGHDASGWLWRCSKRPQDRPKTTPISHVASQGGPPGSQRGPKTYGKSCVLLSRHFASDGHSRPRNGSNRGQGAPRGAQDGPMSAPRAPENAPRVSRE
eukprot:7656314-Pyramimonas_sp.AAC.1